MVRAIVTKWDDVYVLRVPKRYIQDNHLKVGDTVAIEEPLILQQNALAALVRHAKERGPIRTMSPQRPPQPRMAGSGKGGGNGAAKQ
jgi:hypothetical protein